jgi:opacity protein-like surface antigen
MCKPFVLLMTVACVLFLAYPAHAADATKMDVSGGYAFLDDISESQTFNGWAASVGGYFNDLVGLVAEVGGTYKTVTVIGTSVSLSEYSFLAGPKFVSRKNPQVTPFVQVLLGGVHDTAGALGSNVSENNFAVQPGGGVDVNMTPNLGLRLQGDYRMIRSSGSTDNNFRFVIAIVFRN